MNEDEKNKALAILALPQFTKEEAKEVEIEDRRSMVLQLRLRGHTIKEIANVFHVSVATINRDLSAVREKREFDIKNYNTEGFVVDTVAGYDDIIHRAWEMFAKTDADTKIKTLHLIRQTLNDRRKALQDTGVVKKESPQAAIGQQINLQIVGDMDEETKTKAVHAFLAGAMTPGLPEPTPDSDDNEDFIEAEVLDDTSDSSPEG